ncbi:hypothetical protein KAJ87_00610 [Candidatus Pacearchaeota archaeon]|nr:hypothetical protein [Candidatus Pacearchaeota archaeon]
MAIKFGEYQIAFYRRNKFEGIFNKRANMLPKNPHKLVETIGNLSNFFAEASFKWYVVGGMGIDLRIGKMTRNHHDIDLEIPSEQSQEFVNFLTDKNYGLFKTYTALDIYPNKRIIMAKSCGLEKCVPEEGRIKAYKLNKKGEILDGNFDHLCYLDLFFTRESEEGRVFGWRGKIKTFNFQNADDFSHKVNGSNIKLRNHLYELALREGSRHIHERKDRKNLFDHLGRQK